MLSIELKRERKRKITIYFILLYEYLYEIFRRILVGNCRKHMNVTFLDYFPQSIIFKIIHLLNYYIYIFILMDQKAP